MSRSARDCGDELAARAFGGARLDAAHAGGDRALADDGDEADVAGAAHMRAAAQLDGEGMRGAGAHRPHRDDAHFVAVFLAKERARAGADGVVLSHHPRLDRRIVLNDLIGERLDARPAPRR